MKTFLKVVSIVAAACIAVGAIFLTVAGMNYDSVRSYYNDSFVFVETSLTDHDHSHYANIKNVSIDIDVADVTLVYEGDEPRLDGNVQEFYECSLYMNGDTLVVTIHERDNNWLSRINVYPINIYNRVTITLPEQWKYLNLDYEINLDVGSINCDRLDADTLDISISAGNINARDISVERLAVTSDLGIISLQGSVFDSCELHCSAGEINAVFDDAAAMSRLEAQVDLGSITVEGFNADSVKAECNAGNINLTGTIGQSCDLSCDLGSIVLELNDSESNWQAEAVSVDIGSLVYAGRSYSAISGSYLSRNSGDKFMSIDVAAGNINVIFKSSNGRK